MRKFMTTSLLTLGMVLGLAWGQEAAGTPQIEESFVQAAAQGDLYEITSSEMAQERSSNEDVRAFAQRMVEDHTMTTERLAQVAETLGVELPMEPAATHQVKLALLDAQEGAAFDRAYMQQQVVVHTDAVNLFSSAANAAQNEELRGFAEEILPALQEHLQMAQDLAGQVR